MPNTLAIRAETWPILTLDGLPKTLTIVANPNMLGDGRATSNSISTRATDGHLSSIVANVRGVCIQQ